ncbi:avidin/streptavidin family protein [Pendulispora albinea]|uniref:Avidin/streptavidin family protein n=1 Tax=Pendulispora albinea TaxID=2741071 RepID=A0ABZ2M5L9_9BACT
MSIGGTWYNELGSQMNISQAGANISGTYWTAVGDAEGEYALTGQINEKPSAGGQAVGWTVVWTNTYGTSHSVTTWSGQYQSIGGEEEIVTFWLLTTEASPGSDWEATNVGQDTFTRNQPTQQQIERARRRRAFAHPRKATR